MSGVKIVPHLDRSENKITIEEWQDCEPIVDNNKRLQTESQQSDMMRHVASVPLVFLNKWLHEELDRGNTGIRLFGPEMDALVARKLKDPDWKWLRADMGGTKWR